MAAESIRVTRSVSLDPDEIELRVSRSSGPGGQHANKTETRVEARLRRRGVGVADRHAEAARRSRRAGPVLRAVAQDERSQARNRELAVERLVAKLAEALRVERRRVPTTPTTRLARAAARGEAAPREGEARPRGDGRRRRWRWRIATTS